MKTHYLIFWGGMFTLGILLGCGDSNKSAEGLEIVERTDAYNNIERYSRRTTDYAKQGEFMRINPEGNVIEWAIYANDTLHGQRILFADNGDTLVVEHYENGLFQGPYRAYYEGNRLELAGEYIGNIMDGEWKRYYKSGALMESVTLKDNEENGPFTEYHENGKLKAEGYYRNGDHEHGLLKLYDETGELEKTMNCENGICNTVWVKESPNR